MKASNLLLLFFLILVSKASAQLHWLNPKPSGFNNQKISFVSVATGYIINQNGDLFVSIDTGKHWQFKQHFNNAQTFAFNDSTGVIPSTNTMINFSIDNGNNWQQRSTGISGYLEHWTDIVGRDTIFLMQGGSVRSLYRSVNRGVSFQALNMNLPPIYPQTMDFITSAIGWVSGAEGIFKTIDGGITWLPIYNTTTSNNVTVLKFRDTANGFAYLEYSTMLRTTNGGISWTAANIENEVNDILWTSADHAFAVGSQASKTTNGGLTWILTGFDGLSSGGGFNSQYFFNDSIGVATGALGRICKTQNAGSSWTQYSPTYSDITSLAFGDNNTGYATTAQHVYKTYDKGETWAALPLAINTDVINYGQFEHAHFWSRDSGILTASLPARIYKTSDGGQHWDSIYPAAPAQYQNIRGFSFINRDTGFIELYDFSASGLFKTTNAGSNWQQVSSGEFYNKVCFLNNQVGYANRSGTLFRTVNGGITWAGLNIPFTNGINDLWFTSPSKGFIIYEGGYIKMTSDSGNVWTDVNSVTQVLNSNYKSIKFLDNNTGYMTNEFGDIYKSMDAGLNWDTAGAAGERKLSSIFFRPDSIVLFGGISGAIVSLPVYKTDHATLCPGGGRTLISNVTGTSYQWQVNNGSGYTNLINGTNYSGVNTSTLILANIPSSWYGYKYRCISNGANSNEFIIQFENRWTGAINTTWENTGNWSCGTIPDNNTDVIISSGNVLLSSNTSIHSLTLNGSAVFTINAGYNLIILH